MWKMSWQAGERVRTPNDGPGTIVRDRGWERHNGRLLDLSADVLRDRDGVIITYVHHDLDGESDDGG